MFVSGRKVNCRFSYISEILGFSMNIMHYYIDMIRKKTLEEFKARMAPLLSHVTRRRIMTRAPIEKKDVTLLHGTGSSSVVALL